MHEVEIRSFLTKEQYTALNERFTAMCGPGKEERQQTWYLNAEHDLRIFCSDKSSKIVLKRGKVHDEHREELEVQCAKEDFGNLAKIFSAIGCDPKIKWFRHRIAYNWDGITVTLDDTRGYGYIIELEQMVAEQDIEATTQLLKEKLASLNVELTDREEFEKKFKHYAQHWEELTKD